jgi:hypothetical protein
MFKHQVCMKGLNAEQQGAVVAEHWASFVDPVAVGVDAVRFDQHVHRLALTFEHLVYCSYFPGHYRKLARLLRWQLVNCGSGRCVDGQVRYQVQGRRMSGDMNTALGNVLLMCSMMYVWLERNLPKYRFIDNGDDCVIITSRRWLDRFATLPGFMNGLGFPVRLEAPVYVLEGLEFCQTHPVHDGVSWIMCRDPRIVLSKDLYSVRPVRNEREWRARRRSVALCGLALAGNLPVLGEFYQKLLEGTDERDVLCEDSEESGMAMLAKGLNRHYGLVSDAARVSFFMAFGIPPEHQCHYERALRETRFLYEDRGNWMDRETMLPVITGLCG